MNMGTSKIGAAIRTPLPILRAWAVRVQAQELSIGQVGGRSIHASQIQGATASERARRLRALFIAR